MITGEIVNMYGKVSNVFYWQWEMDFLQAIPHVDWFTVIMKIFTYMGEAGAFWIALSIVLAIIPKTRKCGFTMMIAMAVTFILGNLVLKNLLARCRPGWLDQTFFESIKNGIKYPKDYSIPSGHTMNGITASLCIFFYEKRFGILAIVIACIIAFSRMYFFVHWPTDIITGALLGAIDAVISFFIIKKIYEAVEKKKAQKALDEQ